MSLKNQLVAGPRSILAPIPRGIGMSPSEDSRLASLPACLSRCLLTPLRSPEVPTFVCSVGRILLCAVSTPCPLPLPLCCLCFYSNHHKLCHLWAFILAAPFLGRGHFPLSCLPQAILHCLAGLDSVAVSLNQTHSLEPQHPFFSCLRAQFLVCDLSSVPRLTFVLQA